MGNTPLLMAVRFFVGQQRCEVLVEDTDGKRRQIRFDWLGAGEMPANWWGSVCGEVEYQRGQEAARSQGRLVEL